MAQSRKGRMVQSRKGRMAQSRKRSTAERTLRFMFRRRPCMIVALLEVLLMGTLVALLKWLIIIYDNEVRKIAVIENVVAMSKSDEVDEFGKVSDFWRCQYDVFNASKTSAYNFELCKISTERSQQNFAFVIEESLRAENNDSCTDRMRSVPCQTYRSNKMLRADELASYQDSELKGCVGMAGVPMPYALVSVDRGTLVPRIPSEKLRSLQGRIVLSSDLLMRCPNCRVKSTYYRSDKITEVEFSTNMLWSWYWPIINETIKHTIEYCARLLQTFVKGWPDIAMFCDTEEESEINFDSDVYCPSK